MIEASVILTTYESPAWLEKVLWGYSVQQAKAFEIVVADDGSSPATAELIDQMRKSTRLRIQHVWHERQGFQKCKILNQAILRAEAPYLIFSDGDCIPRNDFVKTHLRYAKPGCFLSGSIFRLSRPLSHAIDPSVIVDGTAFGLPFLLAQSITIDRRLRLLNQNGWLASFFERISTTRATFNGYGSSAWRKDLININGFDERLHYGGLDRELGERLVNAGISPISIRHRSVCLHLDHDREYKRSELIAANQKIRREIRATRRIMTDYGIVKTRPSSGPHSRRPDLFTGQPVQERVGACGER